MIFGAMLAAHATLTIHVKMHGSVLLSNGAVIFGAENPESSRQGCKCKKIRAEKHTERASSRPKRIRR
jgi:hypothetical protein